MKETGKFSGSRRVTIEPPPGEVVRGSMPFVWRREECVMTSLVVDIGLVSGGSEG